MRPSPSDAFRLGAAALALLLGGPGGAAAQGPPGQPQIEGAESEGAEFLLIPMGPRAVAMGRAVTASRGTVEAALWNPAGLADLPGTSVAVTHETTVFTQNNVLSVAVPLSIGTLGVTYFLVDFGETERRDDQNQLLGVVSARNQELVLSYARRIWGGVEAGVSYKLVQLLCSGPCTGSGGLAATTHAADVGLILHRPVDLPLTAGVSVLHAGLPLRVQNDGNGDPLPTRVRAGVAYEGFSSFVGDTTAGLRIHADLEEDWNTLGSPDLFLGAEASYRRRVFLRAGYAWSDRGSGGGALGLGLAHDRLYVNLSRRLDEASELVGDPLQVSIGLVF
jgi:hypothetical protein